MKNLILIICTIVSSLTYAGFVKRNGGDALSCPLKEPIGNKTRQVILLETIEQNMDLSPKYSAQVKQISKIKTEKEVVSELKTYFKSKNMSFIFDKIIEPSINFFDENHLVYRAPLKKIHDENSPYLFTNKKLKGCKAMQIAVNQYPQFKKQVVFYLTFPATKMIALDKVKLKIHEVIGVCSRGLESTFNHRYFVNLLFSDELTDYTREEIDDLMKRLQITPGLDLENCIQDMEKIVKG